MVLFFFLLNIVHIRYIAKAKSSGLHLLNFEVMYLYTCLNSQLYYTAINTAYQQRYIQRDLLMCALRAYISNILGNFLWRDEKLINYFDSFFNSL